MTEQSKPAAERFEVAGGYNSEGVTYVVGVNSGTRAIDLSISDEMAVSLHLSLTPDEAERMGRALVAHAEAVRERIAARSEPSASLTTDENGVHALTAHSPFFPRDFDEPRVTTHDSRCTLGSDHDGECNVSAWRG